MSEPTARATEIETVVPGLYHWSLDDDRIGSRTHSHAVETTDGLVLIDPLPLEEDLAGELSESSAICLTGRFHQRSAWRYQGQFEVPVYAPRKGEGYEGAPDHFYDAGDMLPGGLLVVHAPGPTDAHYVFYREHNDHRVMFIADLLIRHSSDESYRFVPSQFMDNPDITRESVRSLLDWEIDILCSNHAPPQVGNVHDEIREALETDSGP